jgi:predicted Zn-dependent peptidase
VRIAENAGIERIAAVELYGMLSSPYREQYIPMITQTTLANGLRVVVDQQPGLQTVYAGITFRAGSCFDAETPGKAHFLEHLVFDGTENFPVKTDLLELIDRCGAIKNGHTNSNLVHYFAETLPEHLDTILEYLAEITIRPLLREEDRVKQVDIIDKEIKRSLSNPTMRANRSSRSAVFQGTAYQSDNLGTYETISALSQDQLRAFWQQYYCANNAVLVIRGNIGIDTAQDAATEWFSAMQSGERATYPDRVLKVPVPITREFAPGLVQSQLVLTYIAPNQSDEHNLAMSIIRNVLGRGTHARLPQRLREQEKLTYSTSVMYNSVSINSCFLIQLPIDQEKTDYALAIIKDEIEKISKELITYKELLKAQMASAVAVAVNASDNSFQAERIGAAMTLFNQYEDPESELRAIQAITREDVLRAAQELFGQDGHLYLLHSAAE